MAHGSKIRTISHDTQGGGGGGGGREESEDRWWHSLEVNGGYNLFVRFLYKQVLIKFQAQPLWVR